MIASGLIFHWWNSFIDPKGVKKVQDDIEPQVLTFEHLEIGFIFCLVPLALSIIAFFYEAIKSQTEKKCDMKK